MKQRMRRVFPFEVPAGGLIMFVLLALQHVVPILADGPLKYGSDRALKEQIFPVDNQHVLARLVEQ